MMGLIDGIVRKTATDAVSTYLDTWFESEDFRSMLDDAIRSHPAFAFMRAMQRRYLEKCTGLTARQAWEHARANLVDFLANERIKFGDDRYDWSEGGARDLADSDLEYWEAA